MFLDHLWLRDTEIVGKAGDYCNFNKNIIGLKCDHHENYFQVPWASLVTQLVKNLPAMQDIRIWSLGWDDPLGKEMATHSGILAWKIRWT